ncbi:MAG: squalene--hopene cyclase [Acidimicrobiaceae bacterium]|nr:squalene--hopene cyclase [Acidimicrobiaceae bacterium]
MSAVTHEDAASRAAAGLAAARDHLLGLQHPDGYWKGELETNVSMDAEDLLLRHFLGILDPSTAAEAAAWIRSQQHDDGTWASFYGGPGDISVTVEAYIALRLAGDKPSDAHLAKAAAWIRAHGGPARARVFTRIWMAMVGQWDWERLPVLPPEIVLLPPKAPLNIYDFGCWARQTIVAMSIVMAHRPVHPLPFQLQELAPSPGSPPPAPLPAKPVRRGSGARRFGLPDPFDVLDRFLHYYEHLPTWVIPRTFTRRSALRLAEEWIIRRQEADGCWGGIQPPLVYSLIALSLQGYPLDHPVMRAALDGMEGFVLSDERGRRIEACQSPVWDTALAVIALADAGVAPDHPALRRATRWLLEEEVTVPGDWAIHRPDLAPGGWAFEFANDNYPDIDDTAEVVLALRRAGIGTGHPGDDAIERAVAWTVGMQCRDGGWGAFDADNDSELCGAIPFCDFGEVTDPPSSDVTAHVLEMLVDEPHADREAIRRGMRWLWAEQESDGSWFGRWGVNYIYGTGAAVPALVAAGASPSDPRIRRAVRWLEEHQNDDGGWGEDLRSYIDDSWRGRGTSTASQTAWALLALLAAGEGRGVAVERGVAWLLDNQTDDGTWDEPWFTGTGFPWDFSLNYHLYRLVFPLTALGRYLDADVGQRREGSAA